jgi:hypothetical protein
MPYDPAFPPDDPWQWWRTHAQPRFLQPNAPANGASGDPAGADGIDDWFVPGQPPKPAAFPGTAPAIAESDGYPNDWIYPNSWNAPLAAAPSVAPPAPSPPVGAFNPGISNQPLPPTDPFAAYWSLIPASRAGAMAWAPPVFLPPNPFAHENIPASKWVTPLPIFLNSPGQSPPPVPAPRDLPPSAAADGLLGGIGKMLAASRPSNISAFDMPSLLGEIAKLSPPSAPADSLPFPGNLLGEIARLPTTISQAPWPSSTSALPWFGNSTGETIGDVAKSAGAGVGQGVIGFAGLAGDARELAARGLQKAADNFAPGSAPIAAEVFSNLLPVLTPLLPLLPALLQAPTSSQLQQAAESVTGPFYQPKTTAGEYARTLGEFAPGALAPGGFLSNFFRLAVLPALASETAGQLTKGTDAEPWIRALAGLAAAAGPGALLHLRSGRAAETAETLSGHNPVPLETEAAENIGGQLPSEPITTPRAETAVPATEQSAGRPVPASASAPGAPEPEPGPSAPSAPGASVAGPDPASESVEAGGSSTAPTASSSAPAAGGAPPTPSTELELPTGIGPGPYARKSIPAGPGKRLSKVQQNQFNVIGDEFGCHTCGTPDPGTPNGNWIGDHQTSTALNPPGKPQYILPHCDFCGPRQGGLISSFIRRRK